MKYQTVFDYCAAYPQRLEEITDDGVYMSRHFPPTYVALKHIPGRYYFIHVHLSYGDYDGSTHIERANVRHIEQLLPNHPALKKFTGQHGYVSIGIDISSKDPEIIDILEALDKDMILDQDTATQVENELIDAAWDDHIKGGFIKAIEKKFGLKQVEADSNELRLLYQELQDQTSNYEIIEGGANVYINVTELVDAMTTPPACINYLLQ